MKYTEALGEALKGRRIRHEDFWSGRYARLEEDGLSVVQNKNNEDLGVGNPSLGLMQSDKWEVEPEKEKPVTVFGVCDPTGESCIFVDKQPKDFKTGYWDYSWAYSVFPQKNLFPKNEFVKLKLVRVDDE